MPLTEAILAEGLTLYVCSRRDEDSNANARFWLEGRPGVSWLDCGVDTVWVRDWGPFFLEAPYERRLGDSWYMGQRPNDNHYATRAGGEHFDAPVHEVPLRFDGGNLLVASDGRCLSSTDVLDSSNRDPQYIESTLMESLGCPAITWLEPVPDEGTGHIDMHALPLPDGRVISSLPENDEALDQAGQEVEPFFRPPPQDLDGDGRDDHATFLNAVWLGEETLLVPVYEAWPEHSEEALAWLQVLLPGVDLVPVPADALIVEGGAIHCVVKGVYRAPPPRPREARVDPEPLFGCSSASPPSGRLALGGVALLLSTWTGRRRTRRRRR